MKMKQQHTLSLQKVFEVKCTIDLAKAASIQTATGAKNFQYISVDGI